MVKKEKNTQMAMRCIGQGGRPLLGALLGYKVVTAAGFIPLLQGIWAAALRLAPEEMLLPGNVWQMVRAPSVLLAVPVMLVMTAWWTLYGAAIVLCGLDYGRRSEKCGPFRLLWRMLLPRNWGAVAYGILLTPFVNSFLCIHFLPDLAMPGYVARVFRYTPGAAVGIAVGVVLWLVVLFFWALSGHYFLLEGQNFREAAAESRHRMWAHMGRNLRTLLCWELENLIWFGAAIALLGGAVMLGIACVGLKQEYLMLSLWRTVELVGVPFALFLLDCVMTAAQAGMLWVLYEEELLPEKLPQGAEPLSGRGFFFRLVAGTAAAAILLCGVVFTAMGEGNLRVQALLSPQQTVTAHRGYSAAAPENTIPAFEAAIAAGADYAEMDVQMTQDGVVVLSHDSNLKRCTGVDAEVGSLTYAEIRKLDAGWFYGAAFAGTRIPTLDQVLRRCKGRIKFNIEIKSDPMTPELEAEVVRIIRENGYEEDCTVTSQDYQTLAKVKRLAPELRTGYTVAMPMDSYYDLPSADFFSMQMNFITPQTLRQAHLRGKTVSAWTVNRSEDIRRMLVLGVDDVITDDPVKVENERRLREEQEWTIRNLRV